MSGGDEAFLKRWSRLKQERREEAKAAPETETKEKTESKPPAAKEPAAPVNAEESDPKVIAELPSIDSLGEHSDYSPFMRPGVPQALKMQALRKMWATDPVISAPDPFEMHNVDFTHLAAPGQVVKTSYQVGKGFLDAVDKTVARLEGESRPEAEAAKEKKIAEVPEKSGAKDGKNTKQEG